VRLFLCFKNDYFNVFLNRKNILKNNYYLNNFHFLTFIHWLFFIDNLQKKNEAKTESRNS
jgi:hypothetical protein